MAAFGSCISAFCGDGVGAGKGPGARGRARGGGGPEVEAGAEAGVGAGRSPGAWVVGRALEAGGPSSLCPCVCQPTHAPPPQPALSGAPIWKLNHISELTVLHL